MNNKFSAKSAGEFAVLFDMNGVVIDDMKYHLDAWQIFAAKRGKTISSEEFDKMLAGRTNLETIHYIVGSDISAEKAKELSEEKEALYREVYAPHMCLLAGLETLLNDLKAHHIPMAVATAAPVENVNMVMDGLKIRDFFDIIVDANQVEHGKPAPDIFLRAAQILNTAPQNCLVFEDSLLGIEAATRAGIPAIGITTSHASLPNTITCLANFEGLTTEKILKFYVK